MKITRQHIEGFVFGIVLIAAIPFLAFAARTATPLVSSLFPNNQVYANIPTPVLSLPAAPGTSSTGLSTSTAAIYFQVTAQDGQGETIGSNMVGTTTAASSTLQFTWPAVNGAVGYKLYFSTSTPPLPQAFVQYFQATSTNGAANLSYTLTSTSSPVFISNIPTSNTAYYFNAQQSTGLGWILGNFGVGTSSPAMAFDVASGTMRAYSVSTSTCAAANDGAVFYNAKDKHLYVCESTVWQLIK